MLKKKLIIFSMTICIIFIFTACSTNKAVQKKEDIKPEHKSPLVTKNIGTEVQLKSTKLPLLKQTPAPHRKVKETDIVVSSFKTRLLDTHKERINNIYKASNKINNYILRPGEVFSFNRVVGKREYKKDYKVTKIIVDGERYEGIGGGICQLSSTIYNAAEKLELKIIERHSHSGDVHYVPQGYDAAVNYGDKDLKFQNTKKYSIKMKIRMTKRRLYVSILKVK